MYITIVLQEKQRSDGENVRNRGPCMYKRNGRSRSQATFIQQYFRSYYTTLNVELDTCALERVIAGNCNSPRWAHNRPTNSAVIFRHSFIIIGKRLLDRWTLSMNACLFLLLISKVNALGIAHALILMKQLYAIRKLIGIHGCKPSQTESERWTWQIAFMRNFDLFMCVFF